MKHASCFRRLARLAAFALAAATPLLAQNEPIPFGPEALLDGNCTYHSTAIETEGLVVALFSRREGLSARTGPSLADLGPPVTLGGGVLDEIPVAVLPGGFVVASLRFIDPQVPPQLVYQRFSTGLAALGPPVVVDDAPGPSVVSLLAGDSGEVTIAYFGLDGHVRARRYSAADAPLTPAIDVDPAVINVLSGVKTALAAGPDGFLVAWEGAPLQTPGLWVRAFGWDGVPAAASFRLTSDPTRNFDVAGIDGGYLAAWPSGDIRGFWLDAHGSPSGSPVSLAHGGSTGNLRLAAGDNGLWATFASSEGGIRGTRIEPGATRPVFSTLLVPEPEGEDYVVPTGLAPASGGFLLGWQLGTISNIATPPPCIDGLAVFARLFGPPRGVVDVPTLPPAGLLVLVLLITAAGLLALSR